MRGRSSTGVHAMQKTSRPLAQAQKQASRTIDSRILQVVVEVVLVIVAQTPVFVGSVIGVRGAGAARTLVCCVTERVVIMRGCSSTGVHAVQKTLRPLAQAQKQASRTPDSRILAVIVEVVLVIVAQTPVFVGLVFGVGGAGAERTLVVAACA